MIKLLETINNQVNHKLHYVPEDDGRDKWQTPQYTAEHKTGDCEDYAILKFFLLLNNGVSEDLLRMCHCMHGGTPHMTLLVYNEDKWLVLDNNIYKIYPVEEYVAIKEKFRFNRTGIWIGENKTRHDPLLRMKKWRDVVSSATAFQNLRLS